MSKIFIREERIEKTDYSESPLTKGEYEECTFVSCNLSSTDLTSINFSDCEFIGCNLSLAKIAKAAFRNVTFKDCKLLGMHFEDCNEFLFEVQFENCILNLSSFYQLKVKKTVFKNCSLHEVDFTETDLSTTIFDNCDLARALFRQTVLEKTDLRTSYNYSIDPETNRIKKAKFSTAGIIGLLDKYDIEIS